MKLSILIPSVSERRNTFLPKSLDMLYGQLEALSEQEQKQVEIIYLIDNKTMMLGDKRNLMVDMAKGEYISFVDCDDRVSEDYISSLLEGVKSGADAIVFLAQVSLNGTDPKICRYSKDFINDYNTATEYHRLPNHIPCIKKSVSKKASFPSLKRAEDAGYAKLLHPHIATEHKIDRVLYYYDYNDMTTVAQEDIIEIRHKKMNMGQTLADVIFISNAEKSGKRMTQNAIDSAIAGANGIKINCIVIESVPECFYNNAVTYNADRPFNYNYYLNFGASRGSAPWVMFCNNDLKFGNGWLHSLILADYPIVSPISVRDFRQKNVVGNEKGWQCGRHLSGWAFMMKRTLWNQIGGLDQDFDFWFADNSLIEQLKKLDLPPMLVSSSRVDHIGSQTLAKSTLNEQNNLMWSKLELFNQKYNQTLFIDHPNYLRWKKLQSV
jgi:glycosyltransferase involved in cell wall biosynthesis